jgi:hypothetical protein
MEPPNRANWTCRFCQHHSTISTQHNVSESVHHVNAENKYGTVGLRTIVIACPNQKCRELTIQADLCNMTIAHHNRGSSFLPVGDPLETWKLRPWGLAKVFPDYVPEPIRNDYEEACKIQGLSPKASATLSRRCLQGMIRDRWTISKKRLVDEIKELKGVVDPEVWDAIDAIRTVGNIGAHMGADINVIVDVDPNEAQSLVGLIEMLIDDWYVKRHQRQKQLAAVKSLAIEKTSQKQLAPAPTAQVSPGPRK